jgi:S1-C subfamily serine protease
LQFKFKSSTFTINRQHDVTKQIDVDEDNQPVKIRFAAPVPYEGQWYGSNAMYAQDWAYAKVNQSSSLLVDYEASTSLRTGEDIHILGFPQGHGVGDGRLLIEPIYNKMSVSRDGLDSEGCILTSQGADHGNSGGPVFALRGNKLVVIGIVSRLDRSDQYNHIVPIRQIKK